MAGKPNADMSVILLDVYRDQFAEEPLRTITFRDKAARKAREQALEYKQVQEGRGRKVKARLPGRRERAEVEEAISKRWV